jgi:hypothetical protein
VPTGYSSPSYGYPGHHEARQPRAEGSTDGYRWDRLDDVTYDLVSVQYHALKAGHDYGQYVRDARNAGQDEIAAFFGR